MTIDASLGLEVLAPQPDETIGRNPLPRLTRKVFTDLAIWMTGLGLVMGVAFPFFAIAFGVPRTYVMTPGFFAATIGAGLLVGADQPLPVAPRRAVEVAADAGEDVEGRARAAGCHVR